jgi:hypothetical protein
MQSIFVKYGIKSGGPPEVTVTPTTATGTATINSVSFIVTNNDDAAVSVSWQIRANSTSGTVVASDTNSVNSNSSFTPSASGLNEGTNYFLTNVIATASGKLPSLAAPTRNLFTLARYSTPSVLANNPTVDTVSFNITNTASEFANPANIT